MRDAKMDDCVSEVNFTSRLFLIGWFDLCYRNTITLILGGGVEQVGGQDVAAA